MKFLSITALVATSFFGHQVIAADCRLMVRAILENNERSLPGVNLTLRASKNGPALASHFSDADGLAKSLLLSTGSYVIRVWPQRLASEAAQKKFFTEHEYGDGAFERILIDVETIAVRTGADKVIEVQLPKAAGY